MIINDGQGSGVKCGVNGKNELKTFAVNEPEAITAGLLGNGYNINTGDIASLTAGDASLIYFFNDEDEDLIVSNIAVGLRGFGLSGDMATITVIRNPTGGNLISDATAVAMNENRNFGSSKTLKSTTLAYKGKAAGTVSGGDNIIQFYAGDNSRLFASIDLVLPRGSSIAMKIDSAATAGTVYAALVLFKKDASR